MVVFSHYDDKMTDGSDPFKTTAVYSVDGILHEVVTAYQVWLELDRNSIPADGETAAILTIRTTGWESLTAVIKVGSSKFEEVIEIVEGVGALELAADTPAKAEISIKEVICETVTLEVL